jgi:hypothetical protein
VWNPLTWLIGLFRRERAKLRRALMPFAISVAEDLFKRDFNGDGGISDARRELIVLLRSVNVTVGRAIFQSYFEADGTLKADVISYLPVEILKKVLAIAQLVRLLRSKGWPVPLPLVVKHGYGLLDSVLQAAYEKGVKPKT